MAEPNVDGGTPVGEGTGATPAVTTPPAHPDTVSWTQYVGLKEKFTSTETKLNTEVASLKEQLKNAVTPDEHKRIQGELDASKAEQLKVSEELKAIKDKSTTEKKAILIKQGVSEDKLKDATEKEIDLLVDTLGGVKAIPKPDLGGGGGSGELTGSPQELARRAYAKSNK